MKVCVYAISKNEEKFAKRWMQSMSEADLVVVTDTGSQDDTVKILREMGATVFEETISPWRFDHARNISLSHVPDDMDILVCTDLDEVFEPGWRQALEKNWRADATMGNYLYNWSVKQDGTPDTQFVYFKIHRKKDYKWVCPVHEHLEFIGAEKEKRVFLNGVVLNHLPDQSKSRSSYLPLLELGVKESPENTRMAYYLGREYMYHEKWQACIDTLTHYLAMPNALWKEERAASMRWIAVSYRNLGNRQQCYRWCARAIEEMPALRDGYMELGKSAYLWEDYMVCYLAIEQGLSITKKSDVFINDGDFWGGLPHDMVSIACYHLKLYEKALYHATVALSYDPQQQRIIDNIEKIRKEQQETESSAI